ncbi:D-amino-acid transaminase [Solibacillus sp. FSL R7-0682]|uniref:D-amino-acid transaminase n=1 Tax=Solibacillus sp. FSL R7-0682 TaxID=2921690 RepID=UPI0030F718CD
MNILWNDQIVAKESIIIDPEDRGYQFGDGIYEVVAIYNGELFEWEAHYERFLRSAAALSISTQHIIEKLKSNIHTLIEENSVEDGYVYFQLTRGTAPRFHAYPAEAVPPVLTGLVKKKDTTNPPPSSMKAITTEDIRWLRVDIKSLNLLPNCMAKQKAIEAGVHEAIFIRDQVVTEASSSNLFGVKNGKLYTHPLNHLILNGITRQVVLRLASQLNLPVIEEAFTKEALYLMDEVFITNTGVNVCPVTEIDATQIGNGSCGVITASLMKAFSELLSPKIKV